MLPPGGLGSRPGQMSCSEYLDYCPRPSSLAGRNESRVWCVTGGCVGPEGRRWEWAGEIAMRLLGSSQVQANTS